MPTNKNKFIYDDLYRALYLVTNIVWIFHNFKYISKMTKCYGNELEERQ